VLPFVNMSGDKEQEYFSDGLTEELLNSLSRINELQVAARTSAFSFKGKDTDIATIARKLNVGAVLEGSVRRSEHTVRITAQLINAVTGFHLWSQSYDRNLGDILALQTEIANAVASALKVTLLGDVAAKIELGGTHDAAAFDAYLRASKAYRTQHDSNGLQAAISAYSEAIRLDPQYALAFAGRSNELITYAEEDATGAAIRDGFDRGQADAHKALALAPGLAEAHLALARFYYLNGSLDFIGATQEYERAMALAPGNARVLRLYGRFLVDMGRTDAGLAAARRAVVLDPLAPDAHEALGSSLFVARQYEQSIAPLDEAIALDSEDSAAYSFRGLAHYGLGNFQRALESCEIKQEDWQSRLCLAVDLRQARSACRCGSRARQTAGLAGRVAAAYQYAEIYAQWGDAP
jgi:TolB-like protein